MSASSDVWNSRAKFSLTLGTFRQTLSLQFGFCSKLLCLPLTVDSLTFLSIAFRPESKISYMTKFQNLNIMCEQHFERTSRVSGQALNCRMRIALLATGSSVAGSKSLFSEYSCSGLLFSSVFWCFWRTTPLEKVSSARCRRVQHSHPMPPTTSTIPDALKFLNVFQSRQRGTGRKRFNSYASRGIISDFFLL